MSTSINNTSIVIHRNGGNDIVFNFKPNRIQSQEI